MRDNSPSQALSDRTLSWFIAFLVISAAYLYSFPQPNVFYAVVVLLHAMGGVLATILLVPMLFRLLQRGSWFARVGWLLIAAGAILGLVLIKTGTPRSEWNRLYIHILISLAGVGFLIAGRLGNRASSFAASAFGAALCVALLGAIGLGARYVRESWQTRSRILNPAMPPDNMNGEGDGPEGAFFPSSAQVYGKQKIPSKFFMESDSCKRCHEDIYNQWFSSAHHFSSFTQHSHPKPTHSLHHTLSPTP